MIHRSIRLLDPPVLLTPVVARMLFSSQRTMEVECQGFAWWPYPRHRDRVVLEALDQRDLALKMGELVLVVDGEGKLDLVRLLKVPSQGERTVLTGLDADPASRTAYPLNRILARARGGRGSSRFVARFHPVLSRLLKIAAICRESREVRFGGDLAGAVRDKYDEQSDAYAGHQLEVGETALLRFGEMEKGSRVLVGGCGTGPDLVALKEMGLRSVGADFSLKMLAHAKARREIQGAFLVAMDLRTPALRPLSFSAVYLTQCVFSFIPERRQRVETLRALRDLVCPGGVLLLSARLISTGEDVLKGLLARRWRGSRAEGPVEWGDSYTSYVSRDGSLHHSYIHLFSRAALLEELREGGWEEVREEGGIWAAKRGRG